MFLQNNKGRSDTKEVLIKARSAFNQHFPLFIMNGNLSKTQVFQMPQYLSTS